MADLGGLQQRLSAFGPVGGAGSGSSLTNKSQFGFKDILPNLAFQGGGALLEALGGIIGGDGGAGRRLRTAEGTAGRLAGAQFNQQNINRQRSSFEQGILSPFLQRQFQQSARRVGSDSGVGRGVALGNAQQLGARFETQAIQGELERVLRSIIAGGNLQANLAR